MLILKMIAAFIGIWALAIIMVAIIMELTWWAMRHGYMPQ